MSNEEKLPVGRGPYLTVKEIEAAGAKYGYLTAAKLYTMKHRQSGPPYHKVGKNLLYAECDLLDWIDSKRVVPENRLRVVSPRVPTTPGRRRGRSDLQAEYEGMDPRKAANDSSARHESTPTIPRS